MRTILDHIVVVAPSLPAGAAFVSDTLGVEPQRGGFHASMGTHNLLLSLGESTYLEIISIDPTAPSPARPRWFALDTLGPADRPRLAAWVVRTQDIRALSAACTSVLGNVEPMSRGNLSWLITVTQDGGLPLGGAAPAVIQWQVEHHPARRLPDASCSLLELEVHHPEPSEVNAIFASIGLAAAPSVRQSRAGSGPLLVAHIQTPNGLRLLAAP